MTEKQKRVRWLMVIGLLSLFAGLMVQTLIVYRPKVELSDEVKTRLQFVKWRHERENSDRSNRK